MTRVVHPFPARMAAEIARDALAQLPNNAVLLDPMCGSGTVVRSAVEHGIRAIGMDIDPLAVLMAKVWSTPLDVERLPADAERVILSARSLEHTNVELAWHDESTRAFIDYWFGPQQRRQLTSLAYVLWHTRIPSRDALMIAMSRIIVTKERGASLARDTSHSRPHRWWETNDYDVYAGFIRSAKAIADRLVPASIHAEAVITRGDCRAMPCVTDHSVDCIITSPPYLNAIDYLRGHRLALVWLGYSVAEIRALRSESVGSERILDTKIDVGGYISSPTGSELPPKFQGWLRRYYADAERTANEFDRVLKPGGRILLVVGNSALRGSTLNNAKIFEDHLASLGFDVAESQERLIPSGSRYLPLPRAGEGSLGTRMRTEVIISAQKGGQ